MKNFTSKTVQSIRYLIAVNFYLAVIVLVGGCLMSVTTGSVFEFNEELYGALDNNLQMMMVYLAITEIVIVAYCLLTKNLVLMVPVGFFLILMVGSLEFYGDINSIAIDLNLYPFFLYTGISHLLFGFFSPIKANQAINTPFSNSPH